MLMPTSPAWDCFLTGPSAGPTQGDEVPGWRQVKCWCLQAQRVQRDKWKCYLRCAAAPSCRAKESGEKCYHDVAVAGDPAAAAVAASAVP